MAALVARVLCPCSVIGKSSRLLKCSAVIDCFVGEHAGKSLMAIWSMPSNEWFLDLMMRLS